jgi:hypothetical protein
MSAFWGLVAPAIVFTAVAAPILGPHDPLNQLPRHDQSAQR